MKIAILSPSDVASWYAATLMERGHQITIGPFGHVRTAVAGMIEDGIDGVLILTDDDNNLEEIAARFTRATSRPVWRNLTDIPVKDFMFRLHRLRQTLLCRLAASLPP